MTREDIIRMAREAGWTSFDSQDERLQRFAALVAAAEREACAKLAEAEGSSPYATKHAAANIRARSNNGQS